jgi:hypothetical protein
MRGIRLGVELAERTLGAEPAVEVDLNGDDPLAYVVSLNVKRRSLTVGQRAIAAAEAWEMYEARRPAKGRGDDGRDRSRQAGAERPD